MEYVMKALDFAEEYYICCFMALYIAYSLPAEGCCTEGFYS